MLEKVLKDIYEAGEIELFRVTSNTESMETKKVCEINDTGEVIEFVDDQSGYLRIKKEMMNIIENGFRVEEDNGYLEITISG